MKYFSDILHTVFSVNTYSYIPLDYLVKHWSTVWVFSFYQLTNFFVVIFKK